MKQLINELRAEGITDQRVLQAMQRVPREQFIDPEFTRYAYCNEPLPIDCEQTISQPYIVALMTQALMQKETCRKVLEVGTGSGYQAAVLAQLVENVYTIERIERLHRQAKARLTQLGYQNIHYLYADGAQGWQQYAPFDGIVVTAAAAQVPQPLLEQLSLHGGRCLIPVGLSHQTQQLLLIERWGDDFRQSSLGDVNFVPLR